MRRPGQPVTAAINSVAQQFIEELMAESLVLGDDWCRLTEAVQTQILSTNNHVEVLKRLIEHGLLTKYQADRIQAGTRYGLVLGNYRVLERVGAGGMGIVFKAEHQLLRRVVAVKVLPLAKEQDPRLLRRFQTEMRTIASLQHPNIVAATDAGYVTPADPNQPVLHYLVMEYVNGKDLEQLVRDSGPLDVAIACELIYQIASGLGEANKLNLVHRDIKPSNVIVTPEHLAKLLDFGLAQDFQNHLTEPGCLLGTIEYMAPEQASDPRCVDIRADIYGLGSTLFWCLTGKAPFKSTGPLSQQIARRQSEPPPSACGLRPELPAELGQALTMMMAMRPDDRYPTPHAVMRALLPFMRQQGRDTCDLRHQAVADSVWAIANTGRSGDDPRRILIADGESTVGTLCRNNLEGDGVTVDLVSDGDAAWNAITRTNYDVVLLDMVLRGKSSLEILKAINQAPTNVHPRVVVMSGAGGMEEMAQMLFHGADDYLLKPFSMMQLQARIKAALRLREANDRNRELQNHLQAVTTDLDRLLDSRATGQRKARAMLVQIFVDLINRRTPETPGHLTRIRRYCRTLAEEAVKFRAFSTEITPAFIDAIDMWAPLHDVGLIALPDHIVHHSGSYGPEDLFLMQTHCEIGAEILSQTANMCAAMSDSIAIAVAIARHHHERFDGQGYPDKLAGDAIPLAARILSIADTYDSLRCRRTYRPAMAHASAITLIRDGLPGKFDPQLLEVFRKTSDAFAAIFSQCPE
jgi:response regulator RpfG family c-di-GMP phosphodiesterase